MRFIPNTRDQMAEMLQAIGVESFGELIHSIPQAVRLGRRLRIPEAMSEVELEEYVSAIAEQNADFPRMKCLLGAGAYRHHVPAPVKALLLREEFWTSYTPYQPEMSQGILQSMFEAQTYFSRLSGLEVVIPSLYDGATAAAEAVLLALRITHRSKILISHLLHPAYSDTIKTYLAPHETNVVEIRHAGGVVDDATLLEQLDESVAAIVVQSPNFLGAIENLRRIGDMAHRCHALLIVVVTEALSLGVLKGPGELGTDLVACDTNSFGLDISFGGPHNAFLASKREYIRQLPGRIVAETQDQEGRRAFVMTLRAREQDIRREKATSNICSNHALNMLAGNIYLSLLGTEGLHGLAELNTKAAHYLQRQLLASGEFLEVYDYPFFNEFALKAVRGANAVVSKLQRESIIPPLVVGKMLGERALEDALLFCVTEFLTKADLDRIVDILRRQGEA